MISVVGLGPGNLNYTLPIAIEKIKDATTVIGGKRNLEAVKSYCNKTMDLSVGFDRVATYLKEHMDESISVVVSGDASFYSMLNFIKRHIPMAYIDVIPGISSLQYMFGKLGKSYEHAKWLSLHGREVSLETYLKRKVVLGILTDKQHDSRYIANQLRNLDYKDAVIYIGERLSYEDEKISRLNVEQALIYEADVLSVVVIDYEV